MKKIFTKTIDASKKELLIETVGILLFCFSTAYLIAYIELVG